MRYKEGKKEREESMKGRGGGFIEKSKRKRDKKEKDTQKGVVEGGYNR